MGETQTLARALDILFALAGTGTQLTVSEIAQKVAIPESTAYRLLQTLEKNGIIERKGKGKIGLGLKILDLARCLYQEIDRELFIVARQVMEELTEKTGETSALMVRSGLNAICILSVESKRLIRFSIENGRVLPLHLSASGKAILAFEDPAIIEYVMSDVKDKEFLHTELTRIKQQGYSITIAELDNEVVGVGVPIYDVYGRVMASLTIAGPAERLSKVAEHELTQAALAAAKKISEKLSARLSGGRGYIKDNI